MLKQIVGFVVFILGAGFASSAVLALVGVGMIRQGSPVLVALAAVALVALPVRALRYKEKEAKRHSMLATGLAMVVWSTAVLTVFPLYFSGEREDALSLGFASLEPWTDGRIDREWGRTVHAWFPEIGGTRVPPEAARIEAPKPPPPAPARNKPPVTRSGKAKAKAPVVERVDEVLLPTEGRKGSLRVPVTVEGPKRQLEVTMLFDTGATLTTLNRSTLRKIGVRVPRDSPQMTMQTAAGPQTIQIVLLDRIWVGGLEVKGVTIAVCEPCATGGTVGLLGNNVSDRFLVTVDGARSELSLASRPAHTDRSGDVAPWIELDAEGSRWPDGRSEVIVEATNRSGRWIQKLTVAIRCKETRYADIPDLGPGQLGRVEVSVDATADCSSFQVELAKAVW